MHEIYPERLRAEYDGRLWDVEERYRKAAQLRWALQAAGLWHKPQKILDVGCGTGLLLARLDDGARRVGCDMRAVWSAQARAGGVEFVQADLRALAFAHATFDLVICLAVIEEIAEWQTALAKMAQRVQPGGVLYVTMTNGKFLELLYSVQTYCGRRVPEGERIYARSSKRFAAYAARDGFGIAELRAWQYTDVTPYLARANFLLARMTPVRFLAQICEYGAPSFGHAWRRP